VKRALRLLRAIYLWGGRFQCCCCGWRTRGFLVRPNLFATNADGYCPRCGAKARHRRLWLYLEESTSFFTDQMRVLEVAPWPSLAARFARVPNIDFVGLDLERNGAVVSLIGDAAALPVEANSFDSALSIHVLEHVEDDRRAIAELYRVLKPGGWALVGVPIRLDRPTHEDPSITDPGERERVFGARRHVRFYGTDFRERLEAAGFKTSVSLGSDVPAEMQARYGLRATEHIFHCTKPADGGAPCLPC
jgi:SAM-dependent methyltransferase